MPKKPPKAPKSVKKHEKAPENAAKPAETASLRLEWRSPEELADNPRNWRKHPTEQKEALKEVLDQVGWAGVGLYNELTGHLIDGHLRKSLGVDKMPVLVGRWTEEQEAIILATLDPLASLANPDPAKLNALLDGLKVSGEHVQKMLSAMAEKAGIIPMDIQPTESEPEQGQLCDAWTVRCPECGHEFVPSEDVKDAV